MKLSELASTIRSKNAGVDHVTFDIIFRDRDAYHRTVDSGAVRTTSRLGSHMQVERRSQRWFLHPRHGFSAGPTRPRGGPFQRSRKTGAAVSTPAPSSNPARGEPRPS